MLKSKIAILIAGALFSAQLSFAAGNAPLFPQSDQYLWGQPTPAQEQYFAKRSAEVAKESGAALANAPMFPQSDELIGQRPLPAQAKYIAERERAVAQEQASHYAYPTIRIHPGTDSVTVEHLGTVRFVDDNGHAFVWQADTLDETALPLKVVAPSDFKAGNTEIYVRHPYSHLLNG